MKMAVETHAGWLLVAVAAACSAQQQREVSITQTMRTAHATVAEQELPVPPASVQNALQTIFAAADVAFAGEVITIVHADGWVDVRFRVDEALRGSFPASVYTLREWDGLWTQNPSRYTVGQRRLMMLHAPSAAGFASPLADGAIPLVGNAVLGSVDLRWLATHVAANDAARLAPMQALQSAGGSFVTAEKLLAAHATTMRADAMQLNAGGCADSCSVPAPVAAVADDSNAHVDRGVVMDLLRAWKRSQESAR